MTSPQHRDAGAAFLRHQEIAFSVCMGMVAVLGRGHPQLSSPALLWAFAALLAFNLGYQIVLRRYGENVTVPLVSMAVNTGLISLVVACSGAADSEFWPMYLLPIFTACLYLKRRHVGLALASSVAFLGCFYVEPIWNGPGWLGVELALKAFVLALAAGVTAQLAVKERRAESALRAAREELERAAETPQPSARRGEPLGRLMNGLLYDMNYRLMLIQDSARLLGSAEGAPDETRSDLARVEAAMLSLRRMVGDLLELSSPQDAPADVARLVRQLPALLEFKLQEAGVSLSARAAEGLPKLAVGRLHLQPALLELVLAAVEKTKRGSAIRLDAEPAEGGALLRLGYSPADGECSLLEQRKTLAARGADVEVRQRNGEVEIRLLLRVDAESRLA